eukprot:gene25609-11260_t
MHGLLACFGRGSYPQKLLDTPSSLGGSSNGAAPVKGELAIFSLEGKELGHVRAQDIWDQSSTRPHLAIHIVNPFSNPNHMDSRDEDSTKRLPIWKAANRVRDSLSRPQVASTPTPLCYLEPNFVSTSFKTNFKLEGDASLCFTRLLEKLCDEGGELLNLCASAVGGASRNGGSAPRDALAKDDPQATPIGHSLEMICQQGDGITQLPEASVLNFMAPISLQNFTTPIAQQNFTAERGLAVADVNPGMCTVVTMNDSEVLFQSRNSREFWGDMTGRKLSPTHGFLHRLFSLQPDLLNEMLQCMQLGEVWHRVIQVKQPNQVVEDPSQTNSPSCLSDSIRARKHTDSPRASSLAKLAQKSSRKLSRNTTVTFVESEDPLQLPTPSMGSYVRSMRSASNSFDNKNIIAAPSCSQQPCVRSMQSISNSFDNNSIIAAPSCSQHDSMKDWLLPGFMTNDDDAFSTRSSLPGSTPGDMVVHSDRSSMPVMGTISPTGKVQGLSLKSHLSRPGSAGEALCNPLMPARSLRAVNLIHRTSSKRLLRRASSVGLGDVDELGRSLAEGFGLSVPAAEEGDVMSILSPQWHEIHATCIVDPLSKERVISMYQSDVTDSTELQGCMTEVTETQLEMLENMYPRHVLEYLTGADGRREALETIASSHADVTILFMDIVGFTSMSKAVAPKQVMAYLNELFTCLDDLVTKYKVYKVETAGDCYIVAGGLMTMDDEDFVKLDESPDAKDGALRVAKFAKAALVCASRVKYPHTHEPTIVRVGMHTGSCVSGLIGNKQMKYSLFGDTMNTASRMESTCKPSCLQVSETTYHLLPEDMQAEMEATGGIEVKGKGLMSTYVYTGETEEHFFERQSRSMRAKPLPGRSMGDMISRQQSTIAKMKNALHTQ